MLNKTLQKKINSRITEAELNINSKIDIFVQQVNSLMNKQELLLKAINEDRLVITKILEHLEKLEKNESLTGGMGSIKRKRK